MHDSFVYRWTDHLNDKIYIGAHKGEVDDGYVCSSKIMLEEYNQIPEAFSRKIIATGSWKDMHDLEVKLLDEVDAAKNPKYYNRSNGRTKFYPSKGHKKREITKLRMRGPRPHINQTGIKNNAWKGYWITPWGKFESSTEAAKALGVTQALIWNYCKTNGSFKSTKGNNKIIQKDWVGKTYKNMGFSFEPKGV